MVYIIHISAWENEDERNPKGWKLGDRPRHYVGWVKYDHKLENRLKEHRAGRGAVMLKRANELGLSWEVVRTFPGATQNEERRIKELWKNTKRLCPVCTKGTEDKSFFKNTKVSDLAMWQNYYEKRRLHIIANLNDQK